MNARRENLEGFLLLESVVGMGDLRRRDDVRVGGCQPTRPCACAPLSKIADGISHLIS